MLAQRIARQSMPRLTVQPYLLSSSTATLRITHSGMMLLRGPYGHVRPVATQKLNPSDGREILAAQRLHRPVSPHLSIYRPQITWYGSALNRITGSILSGGFYTFFAAYLIAPLFGWHLESAVLAASFGTLPLAAKVGLKFFAALPFTYHSLNGLRHLTWDLGRQMRNKQVMFTGWVVVGLTVVSSVGLAFV